MTTLLKKIINSPDDYELLLSSANRAGRGTMWAEQSAHNSAATAADLTYCIYSKSSPTTKIMECWAAYKAPRPYTVSRK